MPKIPNRKVREDILVRKGKKRFDIVHWDSDSNDNARRTYSKDPEQWKQSAIRSYGITGKSCSCWMCGNPRKYFNKKSHGEIIADHNFVEQLLELDDANQ